MTIFALILALLFASWVAACCSVYVARRIYIQRRKARRLQARIEQIIQTY
jgi:hypothetical protein